jgi:hypothetical protein
MKIRTVGLTVAALATAAVFAFGTGFAGSAIASNDDEHLGGTGPGASGPALPMEAILVRLKDQGYQEVFEIEREHGVYEVKVRGQDGGKVELYLDPQTGEILRQERDD